MRRVFIHFFEEYSARKKRLQIIWPLDDVTRNKLALRNQDQMAPFVCYLVSKIENFAGDVTEIIWAKKKFVKL